jgi:hypothetical protein
LIRGRRRQHLYGRLWSISEEIDQHEQRNVQE